MGLCCVEVVPSPKSQAKVYGALPPTADPVSDVCAGASPAEGDALAVAASGPLTASVIAAGVAFAPLASVTTSVALKFPAPL